MTFHEFQTSMCGSVFDNFNGGQRIQSDGIWWHLKSIGSPFLHRNNSGELRWKKISKVIPQMFEIKNGNIFQPIEKEIQEPFDVEMSLTRVCLWDALHFYSHPGTLVMDSEYINT